MAEKSKVLIIGATGHMGKFMVYASVKAGHPTFVLVRESTVSSSSNPSKAQLIQSFRDSGVTLLYGDLYGHESLVKAIKQVDVVISALGIAQIPDQVKIIAAIKEAGNIKRFFPSEYGNDFDRADALEPARTEYAAKVQVRRAVEAEGIPYTYVCSYLFFGYLFYAFTHPGDTVPPRERVFIVGDGNIKAPSNKEDDVATYTIKAVDDPQLLNKILYIRPPRNIYTLNELVSLWEKNIGRTLERTYIPEEDVLKKIQESPFPLNLIFSKLHVGFIKGTFFDIDPAVGVEASQHYPNVKYTTVEEYMDQAASQIQEV